MGRRVESIRPLLRASHRAWRVLESRLILPVPSKVDYARARLRGERGGVVFFHPDRPNPHHILYKVFHRSGWRITTEPTGGCDLAVRWQTKSAVDPEPDVLLKLPNGVKVLNRDCTDTSKRTVDAAAATTFGTEIRVDPRTHVGPCVQKSDANARHDGRIVICPIDDPDPESVYQRIVDNAVGDGTVEDLRLAIVGPLVPFAYRKIRPFGNRFSNVNTRVEMVRPVDVASPDELHRFVNFCRLIGLDYGEVDALRDRGDGRLYVVDANPTPYGPPNHLPGHEARRAIDVLRGALAEAFDVAVRSS